MSAPSGDPDPYPMRTRRRLRTAIPIGRRSPARHPRARSADTPRSLSRPHRARRAAARRRSAADLLAAATSRTASPPAGASDKARAARRGDQRPTSASSPPTTTCSRRISRYERFPELIRRRAREVGAVAQVAGGVPAMCDGVTQGQPGMELSLFSRDVIALATAVALSHDMFDAALLPRHLRQDRAGPADRRAALRPSAGDLRARPGRCRPACPTTRSRASASSSPRARSAARSCSRRRAQSYHGPGTCTFYGTANSNQMLMEVMGLHLPGAAFVNPEHAAARRADPRRRAARRRDHRARQRLHARSAEVVDERAIVNGIVGLHGDRRLDQPHHPPGRHGARRRHRADLGRFRRALARSRRCWRASIRTALPT